MPSLPDFQVYYGVDFSGAKQAGRNTWIARVEPRGKTRRLALASLDRLESLCGTAARAECLAALVEQVRASDAALWGFDFPFGMPVDLFPDAMPWVEQFAFLSEWGDEAYDCGLECVRRATELFQRKHIRRTTDDAARAPFDPYHYRRSCQTRKRRECCKSRAFRHRTKYMYRRNMVSFAPGLVRERCGGTLRSSPRKRASSRTSSFRRPLLSRGGLLRYAAPRSGR